MQRVVTPLTKQAIGNWDVMKFGTGTQRMTRTSFLTFCSCAIKKLKAGKALAIVDCARKGAGVSRLAKPCVAGLKKSSHSVVGFRELWSASNSATTIAEETIVRFLDELSRLKLCEVLRFSHPHK
jgi:hypothetical protein